MQNALYHLNSYANQVETEIASCFEEDGKNILVLKDQLFHPQGGGQKGDKGQIIAGDVTLTVLYTIKDPYSDKAMLIIQEPIDQIQSGVNVQALLDWPFRFRQMRLHGAVHLHHCMMEDILGEKIPKPKSSDIQDDGTAFNRYETKLVDEELVEKANLKLTDFIAAGAKVTTKNDPDNQGFRWWHCAEYSIPCGGTHVHNISEIGTLKISFSKRKGKPKVSIRLLD